MVVPFDVAPSNNSTVLFASAVPLKVKLVVWLVILSVLDDPVSSADAKSGVEGTLGAVVSMVIESEGDDGDSLPARSVKVEVMTCTPPPRVEVVIVYTPPEQTPEPTAVAPSYIVTVSPLVQLPVNVGVVSLVLLSVEDDPVSDAAIRSGADVGALGEVVSIVIERLPEAADVLPAGSVCFAFMVVCAPSESADAVMVTGEDAHTALPTGVVLSYNVTVAPTSQVMVKLGVVSEVILSVDDEPVSEAVIKSGVPGAAGVLVSIVTDKLADATEMFPAASVCFALMLA